jgi:CheY-like chemotaxis protein
MGSDSKKLRLDEILVREGLISQDQINEALMRQQAHGGKLGSQLLYHRYLDEPSLVRALAIQFGCEGVVLSSVDISPDAVALIPQKVAQARRVMPFAYDADKRLLKVAVPDPHDADLRDELRFIIKEKKIKLQLYVAAELSLQTAIAKHYEGRDFTLDDALQLEIPDALTDTGETVTAMSDEMAPGGQAPPVSRGEILLVTDEEYAGSVLQSLLERDHYEVTITNSADDAIELLAGRTFHTVFIKDTVPGDYIDLIDRLRKISPRTVVRYYESASALLLSQDSITAEGDLLVSNLEMFTALLALKDRLPDNHSGAVGRLADRLCRRLGLPDRLRLRIVTAGYLHDLARYYYHLNGKKDQREVIKLTAKLMKAVNYSPVITEMLRSMYKDLKGKYTKRLPEEILGGNILTIVDLYCENLDTDRSMSLDRFEVIKAKYRDVTGKLLLTEVVEPFCEMIEDDILAEDNGEPVRQVMVYADLPGAAYPIEQKLHREHYGTIVAPGSEAIATLSERRNPDCLVLQLHGDYGHITSFVQMLSGLGIDYGTIPTIVLASGCSAAELTGLLDTGVQDVLAYDMNLDLLVSRLDKLFQKTDDDFITGQIPKQPSRGTQGRLTDMNLIDLLQALGPSRKTVRLIVTPDEGEDRLIMFLKRGAITFAQYGPSLGAEAVYPALGWTEGSWWVQPWNEEELPEPNNDQSNESIMMEGCRLIDEAARRQT